MTSVASPVVTVPTLAARTVLLTTRALRTPLRVIRLVVSPRVTAAARAVVAPFEALTSTEAVTITVPTTPA
ncbi:hypothetical protein [Actinomyces viscosus]|uniref:hypothetical protein n=1 Tax=Actinomyces viscosus TaxID=1656 RepID=UPI0028E37AAE|nr:hypothetical protein [Actinomyces viscosus]